MNQTPSDVVLVNFIFIGFWLMTVVVILVAGKFLAMVGRFRQRMLSGWKPALVSALIFDIGLGLGGSSWLNLYSLAVFCQVMIGLAIAYSIDGFNPLPVCDAIHERQHVVRQIALLVGIALLAVFPALIIGTVGLSIGRQIFGETTETQQAVSTILKTNKWLVFFPLLGGAGIAEEATYRLVVLSFIWKVTGRRWLAIVFSSLVFGAYHLTPLDSMYRAFLQYPISQFTASALIGLVWGYLFTKRGYGTAVLGHTLSDWLPMMLFMG